MQADPSPGHNPESNQLPQLNTQTYSATDNTSARLPTHPETTDRLSPVEQSFDQIRAQFNQATCHPVPVPASMGLANSHGKARNGSGSLSSHDSLERDKSGVRLMGSACWSRSLRETSSDDNSEDGQLNLADNLEAVASPDVPRIPDIILEDANEKSIEISNESVDSTGRGSQGLALVF